MEREEWYLYGEAKEAPKEDHQCDMFRCQEVPTQVRNHGRHQGALLREVCEFTKIECLGGEENARKESSIATLPTMV